MFKSHWGPNQTCVGAKLAGCPFVACDSWVRRPLPQLPLSPCSLFRALLCELQPPLPPPAMSLSIQVPFGLVQTLSWLILTIGKQRSERLSAHMADKWTIPYQNPVCLTAKAELILPYGYWNWPQGFFKVKQKWKREGRRRSQAFTHPLRGTVGPVVSQSPCTFLIPRLLSLADTVYYNCFWVSLSN